MAKLFFVYFILTIILINYCICPPSKKSEAEKFKEKTRAEQIAEATSWAKQGQTQKKDKKEKEDMPQTWFQ